MGQSALALHLGTLCSLYQSLERVSLSFQWLYNVHIVTTSYFGHFECFSFVTFMPTCPMCLLTRISVVMFFFLDPVLFALMLSTRHGLLSTVNKVYLLIHSSVVLFLNYRWLRMSVCWCYGFRPYCLCTVHRISGVLLQMWHIAYVCVLGTLVSCV